MLDLLLDDQNVQDLENFLTEGCFLVPKQLTQVLHIPDLHNFEVVLDDIDEESWL